MIDHQSLNYLNNHIKRFVKNIDTADLFISSLRKKFGTDQKMDNQLFLITILLRSNIECDTIYHIWNKIKYSAIKINFLISVCTNNFYYYDSENEQIYSKINEDINYLNKNDVINLLFLNTTIFKSCSSIYPDKKCSNDDIEEHYYSFHVPFVIAKLANIWCYNETIVDYFLEKIEKCPKNYKKTCFNTALKSMIQKGTYEKSMIDYSQIVFHELMSIDYQFAPNYLFEIFDNYLLSIRNSGTYRTVLFNMVDLLTFPYPENSSDPLIFLKKPYKKQKFNYNQAYFYQDQISSVLRKHLNSPMLFRKIFQNQIEYLWIISLMYLDLSIPNQWMDCIIEMIIDHSLDIINQGQHEEAKQKKDKYDLKLCNLEIENKKLSKKLKTNKKILNRIYPILRPITFKKYQYNNQKMIKTSNKIEKIDKIEIFSSNDTNFNRKLVKQWILLEKIKVHDGERKNKLSSFATRHILLLLKAVDKKNNQID